MEERFDEEWYLDQNPGIRAEIEAGRLRSGLEHYLAHGKAEGRQGSPLQEDRLSKAEAELAESFIHHNRAAFLAPTELVRTPLTPRRILLIGPCGMETIQIVLRRRDASEVDYVNSGGFGELPDEPPKPASEYDFQVIELTFRAIMRDGTLWRIPYDDVEAHERYLEAMISDMRAQLRSAMKWNERFGLMTFVQNFALPQANPLGNLFPRYEIRNPIYLVEQLNQVLEKEILAYGNAYLLDIDRIKASYGRRYVQDDSYYHTGHHGHIANGSPNFDRVQAMPGISKHYVISTEEMVDGIWGHLLSLYRTIKQVDSVKLVVVDLDDTVWKGLAGELIDHQSLEDWPLGIWEALAYLRKRGILLSIISRNQEEQIRELWPKVVGNYFKLEYFVSVKINWRPKVENMQEILAETNLLPRSVVFIDDHPVERAAMQAAYPDMRVIGRFAYYVRKTLLWSSETQVPFITGESAQRTEMVQGQIARMTAEREMPRGEFLKSLDLKVDVRQLETEDDRVFNRCFELLNKTNQFNTTGRRWTSGEFKESLAAGTVYYFEAADKFVSYGMIGVVMVRERSIDQFVMSCRVSGLDIELAVMSAICVGQKPITAKFETTDANFLCRDFFNRCGFQETLGGWILPMGADVGCPEHIGLRAQFSVDELIAELRAAEMTEFPELVAQPDPVESLMEIRIPMSPKISPVTTMAPPRGAVERKAVWKRFLGW